MDAVTGGLLAAAAAWASVLVVALVPLDRWIPPEAMRRVGGSSLVLLAASVLGVAMPLWLPLGFLGAGLAVASWGARRSTGASAEPA